jgi:hypothetical protein
VGQGTLTPQQENQYHGGNGSKKLPPTLSSTHFVHLSKNPQFQPQNPFNSYQAQGSHNIHHQILNQNQPQIQIPSFQQPNLQQKKIHEGQPIHDPHYTTK